MSIHNKAAKLKQAPPTHADHSLASHTIPPSTSFLSSVSPLTAAPPSSNEPPPLSSKQSLCLDILIQGHVNSYVDFFYLTHRVDSGGQSSVSLPDEKLPLLCSHLTCAEIAHRKGDSEKVYESYEALAGEFHRLGDYKTSIYFYEKCLDLAESMEDLSQQCSSNLNLGLTHDAMNETSAAIRFHEKHKELAKKIGAASRIQAANQHLLEVYRRYAEEHERREDNGTAVLLYKQMLECAQEAADLRGEGLATYRLGVACAAMGDKTQSIEFQQKYLHICKKTGDQLGEGAACAALAHSFRSLGDLKLAISYLEKYHQIASKNKQNIAQAEACSALGSIYSAQCDHATAVMYFEKTFDIARSVGDRKLVDSARINLGMARGNMTINKYMDVVQENLPALLEWKTKRQTFKQG